MLKQYASMKSKKPATGFIYKYHLKIIDAWENHDLKPNIIIIG